MLENVDQAVELHVLTIMFAEQQTMNFYLNLNVGPQYMDRSPDSSTKRSPW